MLAVIIGLPLLSFLGKSIKDKNNSSGMIKDITALSHGFIHFCLPDYV